MNKRAAALLLSALLLFGVTGCGATGASTPALGMAAVQTASSGTASENETKIDEQVFPKDRVIDVRITIDEADFQDMLANAGEEEYKTASVNYNGVQLDHVAVRTKGNLSLRSVVNSDSERYSFKLAFDEYISSQNLYGLTKINLNNNYSDASYMREFLTYELAEQMGLPVPKYSFVNVYVNGELKGFYLAVEQVGEAYLERNFGSAYGALYKANGGTGSDLTWMGDMDSYTGLTLKSESTNDDVLLKLTDALNNGGDLEQVLDVDEALSFIALNVLTANMDSYLGQNKHNYYLYEDEGKFSVLPWDYNMAFGGLGGTGLLIDEPTQGTLAERPLVAKLLEVEEYKEKYHAILSGMIQGYLADETFSTRVQELSSLISSHVEKDPTAFVTYEAYQQGVTQLKQFASQQAASIASQLDGTSPSSGDGSGSGGGMGGGMPGGQAGQGAGAPAGGGQPAGAGQAEPAASLGGTQAGQPVLAAAAAGPGAAAGQGQNGQTAAGQGAAGGQMGQRPGGMGGGPGGMPPGGGGPGGMGGGPGGPGAGQQQGSASEAIATGAAMIVLLAACLIVTFYKRNRL
ncbi:MULTISPECIES: CotH kinase family protein [Paenibacillus]|uniref:CotH kinase family protein n=1 Tax=Paenibacillus TaxID=44249 RepID=UPI0022B8FD5A|nr:CotH kinase family protein [Paenibacillus caseinilyticus]MCZ8522072.1 CotH kinase family protein [Paenibacillus caseinilyticus]